jgi:hypothetical protein
MSMENQKILPAPTGKVLPFTQLQTFAQAKDYALGGYHASRDKAEKESGARQRLWADAAEAYRAAYLAMYPLESLPGAEGLSKARELLGDANHKADVASATSASS